MPALHEKRLREVHEGEVQLALRPFGIGEVGVLIISIFIGYDALMQGRVTRRGGECAEPQRRLDMRR